MYHTINCNHESVFSKNTFFLITVSESLSKTLNSGVEVAIFLCSVLSNSFAFKIQFNLKPFFKFVIGIADYLTP